MNKSNYDSLWLSLSLDRGSATSLQAQLAGEIRRLVHEGRLVSGIRLPPSRGLADELSVSRITVTTAYDQLTSEGYLEGRRGSGIFVAPDLSGLPKPPLTTDQTPRGLPPPSPPVMPFDTSMPDHPGFPHRQWAKLFEHVWRAPDPALLSRQDGLGWGPLRVAIAQHLRDWRGIRCEWEQVVVTGGLGDAIELIGQTVLSRNDSVAVEEPGHGVLRRALARNGLECQPIPVDSDGFDVDMLRTRVKALVVTPSRQFPLGMTMPLSRRLRLLKWAQQADGFVIEDDFDGEYRYHGQPRPAMMSLDDKGCVIYVGSFSKVMFTGLRLGFLVMPAGRAEAVRKAMRKTGPRASGVAQPVLARFMEEGHFAKHLRRMRRLYGHRLRVLVAALQDSCSEVLEVEEMSSGMHLVAGLSPSVAARMTDVEAAERAAQLGVSVRPLSGYFARQPTQQGLVLGFAGFDDAAIKKSAADLGRALSGDRL